MKVCLVFLFTSAVFLAQPALAASFITMPTSSTVPQSPPPVIHIPQSPTPQPETPRVPEPPPVVRIPVVPIMPQLPKTDTQTPFNPMDVTRQLGVSPESDEAPDALHGIQMTNWPDRIKESGDAVLVRASAGTRYSKITPYTVQFDEGEALISVRKPTSLAFITFEHGQVALTPDSDILIKSVNGTVHITNFDGAGEAVKIKLNPSSGRDEDAKVIALARGYELIVSARVLKRNDIRIADGSARRHFKMLDGGTVAVCEISTESVLNSSAVVAQMVERNEGGKDHRILVDLSKMAAVLNYVNGTEGFTKDTAPNAVARN